MCTGFSDMVPVAVESPTSEGRAEVGDPGGLLFSKLPVVCSNARQLQLAAYTLSSFTFTTMVHDCTSDTPCHDEKRQVWLFVST